jgi:hypothetical protein
MRTMKSLLPRCAALRSPRVGSVLGWAGVAAGALLLSACDDAGLQCKSDESFEHGACVKNYGVRLNSVGYQTDRVKRATFAGPSGDFQVIAADGSVVKSGTASGPKTDIDTAELLWEADFSSLTDAGSYHMDAAGGTLHSASFQIGSSVYDPVLSALMIGLLANAAGWASPSSTQGTRSSTGNATYRTRTWTTTRTARA